MLAVRGPAVLAVLAIALTFGAAVVIGVIANRNAERPAARRDHR